MHAELQSLADQLAVDLDRSVLVEDSELRLLAASALVGVVDQSRRDSILMRRPTEGEKKLHRRYRIATTREPVRLAADEQLGTLARWCLPLRTHVLHGYLWLIDEPQLTDEQLRRASAAAALAVDLLASRRQERAGAARLLGDLLDGEESARRGAAARLLETGALADDPPFTVVAVHEGGDSHHDAAVLDALGARWEQNTRPGGVLATTHARRLVAVVTAGAAAGRPAAEALISAAEGDSTGLAMGAGAPVAVLADLGDQLGNARYAARVAAAAPEFGGTVDWARLGGYALFQEFEQTRNGVERLCPGATVLLHPRNAMYRTTVETYLATCGDSHLTAQRLHIHRSTLYWRLNRAEQMLGRSLGDATVRVDLHLALRLARLLAT